MIHTIHLKFRRTLGIIDACHRLDRLRRRFLYTDRSVFNALRSAARKGPTIPVLPRRYPRWVRAVAFTAGIADCIVSTYLRR